MLKFYPETTKHFFGYNVNLCVIKSSALKKFKNPFHYLIILICKLPSVHDLKGVKVSTYCTKKLKIGSRSVLEENLLLVSKAATRVAKKIE